MIFDQISDLARLELIKTITYLRDDFILTFGVLFYLLAIVLYIVTDINLIFVCDASYMSVKILLDLLLIIIGTTCFLLVWNQYLFLKEPETIEKLNTTLRSLSNSDWNKETIVFMTSTLLTDKLINKLIRDIWFLQGLSFLFYLTFIFRTYCKDLVTINSPFKQTLISQCNIWSVCSILLFIFFFLVTFFLFNYNYLKIIYSKFLVNRNSKGFENPCYISPDEKFY